MTGRPVFNSYAFGHGKSKKKTWPKVLELLNEKSRGVKPLGSAPYSPISLDLLAENRKEMAKIEKDFLEFSKGKKWTSLDESWQAEIEFFHRAAETLNASLLTELDKQAVANKKSSLNQTVDIAQKVVTSIRKNAVAKLSNVTKYPQGSNTGYCFGRALLAHYLLLKAGVKQSQMAKIFTVGELLVEGQLWNFHMAVLLKDRKHGFIVVDPMHKEPLPYKEWLKVNKNYGIKRTFSRVRFYVTDPRKFLPSFSKYDLKQILDKDLKSFFNDLIKTL